MSDTTSVLLWWLTLFTIGMIFLPFTTAVFKRFLDRGYIFSKVIGIVISSYIFWLAGSFHILSFTQSNLFIVFILFAGCNLWITFWKRKTHPSFYLPWRWILFEESLFLVTLTFWSYVKATEPSIHGLEKFMDFGFVNSILRGNFFPPLDMWLTKSPEYTGGYFINYYYFGHYVTAFLTRLSGIDSSITYNLMIASLFGFTFTLSFSLGMNLYYFSLRQLSSMTDVIKKTVAAASDKLNKRRKQREEDNNASLGNEEESNLPSGISVIQLMLVGFLAAIIVSLGGNLHTLYVFTTGYPNESPQPPWQLELGFHPERYWYPNATRFIPFTIHEFPIYSFVVSDLHGHVSDIPFVLTAIAILLTLTERIGMKKSGDGSKSPTQLHPLLQRFALPSKFAVFEQHTSVPLPLIALLGLFLAVMYMTNAWDGLIYMMLTGCVFLYLNFANRHESPSHTLTAVIYKTFSASLFLLFFFLLTSLPFSLNFKPFVSGIGVLCAPQSLVGKTIGPFLFEVGKCQKSPLYMLATLWGFFYFNVFCFLLLLVFPSLKKKVQTGISGLTPTDIFAGIIIAISTLLLIFPEYFYMKDIYPAHYRANTMFKLGYQAFIMLGLISSYVVFRLKHHFWQLSRRIPYILYGVVFLVLFSLVAIYPYFAIMSYFGSLKTYHGLPGLNWFSSQYPDDYQAIMWLRNSIPDQPVIAEANGDSYTDYGRVSANTGLPTIIGWPVHEWLWRGSYDEAGKRIPEVATIYESTDLEKTKYILHKYNVSYIFVGTLEREKYTNLNEDKFKKLGSVIYQTGNTRIYKVSLN